MPPSITTPEESQLAPSWYQSYQLWFTPSFSLSLLLERERGSTLWRFFAQLLLWFRALLRQPSVLASALSKELKSRPLPFSTDPGGEVVQAVISAHTLRAVDHALFASSLVGKRESRMTPIYPDELALTIGSSQGIGTDDAAYKLLQESVSRVLYTSVIIDEIVERSELAFSPDGADDAELCELFGLLKPDMVLSGLVSKQWQEIGFQGSSPSTDFRGLGMLALDSLRYFGREYGERAIQITDEAVNGGPNWYPLALASIHMTSFALDMAVTRDLQLLLLRSLQAPASPRVKPDTTPFLRASSELLILFHAHWLRNNFSVMQFEAVSKDFQKAVRPWVRRGVLDGRALGWMDAKKL